MLRNIQDSDIILGARLRMSPQDEAFGDCVITKIEDNLVSLDRAYYSWNGFKVEKFGVSPEKLKSGFQVFSNKDGKVQTSLSV